MLSVSYRQAKRLWKRYRRRGAKGLVHGNAARPSNGAKPAEFRERVLRLVREKYSGEPGRRFGPTLAAKHLASDDGLKVNAETLRLWMLEAELWSRVRERKPYRSRRERKPHFGELVQLDGSFHDWLEGRGPRLCLMNMVDDATGTTFGQFHEQETIWAAVDVFRAWVEKQGVPRALYTDWKNVYVRKQGRGHFYFGMTPSAIRYLRIPARPLHAVHRQSMAQNGSNGTRPSGSRLSELLRKVFMVDLLKGMALTFGYQHPKYIYTEQYPKTRPQVAERYRGAPRLNINPEDGETLCIACNLCALACPETLIVVGWERAGGSSGKKTLTTFTYDTSRCMFCGLCEDACPTDALELTQDFELANYTREGAIWDRQMLEEGPHPTHYTR